MLDNKPPTDEEGDASPPEDKAGEDPPSTEAPDAQGKLWSCHYPS